MEFELIRQLGNNVWLAGKPRDARGERYLAWRASTMDGPRAAIAAGRQLSDEDTLALAFRGLMDKEAQARAVSMVLNHPNLVSLVGNIEKRNGPHTEEYLVWDFCDAANLSCLFMANPCRSSHYYLPESLCWHAAVSLTRAVAYLHDGQRRVLNGDSRLGDKFVWQSMDEDWNPILHRAIEPKNIFFQHPRGSETYGLCKLGNFSHVAVTGHLIRENAASGGGSVCIAPYRGWEPLEATMSKLNEDPVGYQENNRLYTLKTELWSVGNIIFTMMTGRQLIPLCKEWGCDHILFCTDTPCCLAVKAKASGCECPLGGCEHIPKEPCQHGRSAWKRNKPPQCRTPFINVDTVLAHARYTWRLRNLVRLLLCLGDEKGSVLASAMPVAGLAEEARSAWRSDDAAGREYVDVEDDLTARWEESMQQSVWRLARDMEQMRELDTQA